MKKNDPVSEAVSSASRLTNLLTAVLALGTLIGLLTSAIVSLFQSSTTSLIVLIVASVTLTVIILVRLLASEMAYRSSEEIVGTAMVLDPALDRIVPPIRLRMDPRLTGEPIPFPIQSMQTHKALQGINFTEETDRLYVEPLCTLLAAFSEKLSMMDNFIPSNTYLNRGPFLSNRSGVITEHRICGLDEIAPSIIDTGILKKAFPSLTMNLPKGTKLRVSLSAKRQPLLSINSAGVSLTLSARGGVGGSTKYSAWKRAFPTKANDCVVHGISFLIRLTFGGLSLWGIGKRKGKAGWSFANSLGWFSNVYNWMKSYLDWLDSDDDIEEDKLFELVEEFPPHYKYAKGAIPPGNGHIVFDMA